MKRRQVWELNRLGVRRRQARRLAGRNQSALHRQALHLESIALFAPNARQTALSHFYLGLALIDAGDKAEAESELRAAIAAYQALLPPDGAHPFSASARLALDTALLAARKPTHATQGVACLREAVALRERFLGADDARTLEARQALVAVTRKIKI